MARFILLVTISIGLWLLWRKLKAYFNATETPQQHQQEQPEGFNPPALSPAEARKILNVHEGASRDEIIGAHRRLIQKLHPDRGGNDYLASRVNAAKECLLRDL